jgi:hypothetical protein
MESARTTWTDERLDDLNRHIESGFARLDARFEHFEVRVDARFEHLEARIDTLQRTLIQLSAGMMTGIVATLVTVVLTRGG